MTKLEQVARAMRAAEYCNDSYPWETAEAPEKGEYLHMARAALAALREPDEKMIEAGLILAPAKECWQAMIDAILAEETK